MSAFDSVTAARANDRPTAVDYITRIFGDSFIEFHGDRRFADDKAVIGRALRKTRYRYRP